MCFWCALLIRTISLDIKKYEGWGGRMLSTCHEHTFNKIYWIKEEKRRAVIPNKFKEKGKEYRTVCKKI